MRVRRGRRKSPHVCMKCHPVLSVRSAAPCVGWSRRAVRWSWSPSRRRRTGRARRSRGVARERVRTTTGLVAVEPGRPAATWSAAGSDRRDALDQGDQRLAVVRVRAGDPDRQGQTGAFGQQMDLRPVLAPIHRIRTRQLPLFRARMSTESTAHRDQSKAPRAPSSSNRTRCSFAHTRAWRHNGEPLIDTASLRRWAAIQSPACLGQDANPIPRLRALRNHTETPCTVRTSTSRHVEAILGPEHRVLGDEIDGTARRSTPSGIVIHPIPTLAPTRAGTVSDRSTNVPNPAANNHRRSEALEDSSFDEFGYRVTFARTRCMRAPLCGRHNLPGHDPGRRGEY